MLEFMKNQVYRKPFIVYTLSLILVCTIVCVVLFQMILNSQLEQFDQETLREFESTQSNITLNVQKIDNYFLGLYAEQNSSVLMDFMRFFGNDAETYMSLRIKEVPSDSTVNDFIEDITNFVSSNQYSISQISFLALDNSNIIYYEKNGSSQIEFNMPNPSERKNNIALGYNYTKKILQPNDMTITLGEVNFLISAQSVFANLNQYSPGYIAVMSKEGELFFDADEELNQQFLNIYDSEKTSGKMGSGFFGEQHYVVYTSEQYGYKMISLVKNSDIIYKNSSLFLFVILGILFIFVSITLLLAMRMSYDARYLNRITKAIDHAKFGEFTKIDIKMRKDEYCIIALKLNDMSQQLEEHIQKEYILKLKQKEAEMKMLQQQINPHFLYNTLETIRSCALMNKDDIVAEAIYNLGGMFREVVKSEDVIFIENELDIFTKYLKIMELKLRGQFYYQIDVDQDMLKMKTVKFWLQPLVENFFVHGFDKSSDFNLVIIRGRRYEKDIVFEIVNNGEKIDKKELDKINQNLSCKENETSDGISIGLQNVYTRLSFFYGDSLKMNIRNNEEAGITITVLIKEEEECTVC